MPDHDEALDEVARLRIAIARINMACTDFQQRGRIVPASIYDEVRAAVQTASSCPESPEERHHRQLHDGELNQMPPEHE